MGVPLSDVAVELVGACVHALRFAVGTPLGYPYAAAGIATTNPPPALYRRVQVASPPPARGGEPWETGMTLDNKEFQPDALPLRLAEVKLEEGIASLDLPDPGSIVLDRWFSVPRRSVTMEFPGSDLGRCLLSVHYWNPSVAEGDGVTRQVDYYGTYTMKFDHPLPADSWIAVSIDNFWPPERDSADLLVPLTDCESWCPATAS
ncbi:hypothetical protein AB0M02_24180 [Actinoplanes sp. NPDC051861]|uniref:hypothetical protein n=1 Tax=Actinoplanes sp. NPDC051861 TaxID=3155170 RepID=UPI00342EDC42